MKNDKPSAIRFQVKIDHGVSDTEQVRRDILLERPALNPKRFANRYEEVKEAVFLAAHRAATETWHAAFND